MKWFSVNKLPKVADYGENQFLIYSPRLGIRLETVHPSWWNYRDKRGKEFNGPRVTHWMHLPAPPIERRTPEKEE